MPGSSVKVTWGPGSGEFGVSTCGQGHGAAGDRDQGFELSQ